MATALYGPNGFYSSGRGVAGRRKGDFITSPEVGPLFGELVAEWINRQWNRLGRPGSLPVYDLGTGPGTLLKTLEVAKPECSSAWSLRGVDLAQQTELPPSLEGAVVVANELLDNVPFRWLRRLSEATTEAWVVDNELDWRPSDASAPTDGDSPLIEGASSLTQQLLDSGPAAVLMFDYGSTTTSELAVRGDWLRCYRGHQRGADPLAEPGFWDITTDVPLDQLPPPTRTWVQAQWCAEHRLSELVSEGRQYWSQHAAAPDLTAFRMRSRISEAAALTDPGGLGAFWVAEWQPGQQCRT